MITKNEEHCLSRCLESVRELVDEMIIVDTGSTDRTVEIARCYGARLLDFAWRDDFSAARNHGLDAATGDWILVVDADESIAGGDHEQIRAWLRREDVNAVSASQRHYLLSGVVVGWQAGAGGYAEGEPYPGFVDVSCRRLFRNHPSLRFRNRVHEELVSNDSRRPLVQAAGDWVIHHYGKAGAADVLRNKAEAYLRLGLLKASEVPEDPRAHYELGVQYSELHDWNAAIPCFEQALTLKPGFRDSHVQLAICHRQRGDYRRALDALAAAERTNSRHAAEIAVEQALIHIQLSDPAPAEAALRRALLLNPGLAVAATTLTRIIIVRARTLIRRRQFAEARDCLASVAPGGGDDAAAAEFAGLQGAVALGLGRPDQAITHLCTSLRTQPSYEAALNLSIALEARGDRAGALDAAVAARDLSPEEPHATQRVERLSCHV
jgi:Flp pilus assembly protein TadD